MNFTVQSEVAVCADIHVTDSYGGNVFIREPVLHMEDQLGHTVNEVKVHGTFGGRCQSAGNHKVGSRITLMCGLVFLHCKPFHINVVLDSAVRVVCIEGRSLVYKLVRSPVNGGFWNKRTVTPCHGEVLDTYGIFGKKADDVSFLKGRIRGFYLIRADGCRELDGIL